MALTRGVSAGLISALADHFHPALLIEAGWPDGTIYMHSGVGELTWNGQTWTGMSAEVDGRIVSFVQIEIPEEAGGLATGDASVHVAGTREDLLAQKGKQLRNLELNVWFGATTETAGTTLVSDPVLLFSGYYASQRFSFTGSINEFLHDMILGLGIGPSARAQASITHTYEDQIDAYPGDTAGRHVQHAIKRAVNPSVWPEP